MLDSIFDSASDSETTLYIRIDLERTSSSNDTVSFLDIFAIHLILQSAILSYRFVAMMKQVKHNSPVEPFHAFQRF